MKKAFIIMLGLLLCQLVLAQSPNIYGDISGNPSIYELKSNKGATNGYVPLGSNLMINPSYMFPSFNAALDGSFWVKSGSNLVPVVGSGADIYGLNAGAMRFGRLQINTNFYGLEQLDSSRALYIKAGGANNKIFFYYNSTVGAADSSLTNYAWSISPAGIFVLGGGSFAGNINLLNYNIVNASKITNANLVINMSSASPTISFPLGNLVFSSAGGYGVVVPSAPLGQTNWALNENAANLRYGRLSVSNTWSGTQTFNGPISVPVSSLPQSAISNLGSDLASKLPLAGGSITGILNMTSNKITGLTNPVDLTDAVPLGYLQSSGASNISLLTNAVGTPAQFARTSPSGIVMTIPKANITNSGYLSADDWNYFNNKTWVSNFASPFVFNANVLSMPKATAVQDGYVSAYDWNRFNNAAQQTLSGNVPIYYTGGVFWISPASLSSNGYLTSSDYQFFYTNATNISGGGAQQFLDPLSFTLASRTNYLKHATNASTSLGGITSNDFQFLMAMGSAGNTLYAESTHTNADMNTGYVDLVTATNLYVFNLSSNAGPSLLISVTNAIPGKNSPSYVDLVVRSKDSDGNFGQDAQTFQGTNRWIVFDTSFKVAATNTDRVCVPAGGVAWFRFMTDTNNGSTDLYEVGRSVLFGETSEITKKPSEVFVATGPNAFYYRNTPAVNHFISYTNASFSVSAGDVTAGIWPKDRKVTFTLINTNAPGGTNLTMSFSRIRFRSPNVQPVGSYDSTITAQPGETSQISFVTINGPYDFCETYRQCSDAIAEERPIMIDPEEGVPILTSGSYKQNCSSYTFYTHLTNTGWGVVYLYSDLGLSYAGRGPKHVTLSFLVEASDAVVPHSYFVSAGTSKIVTKRPLLIIPGEYTTLTLAYEAGADLLMEIARTEPRPMPPVSATVGSSGDYYLPPKIPVSYWTYVDVEEGVTSYNLSIDNVTPVMICNTNICYAGKELIVSMTNPSGASTVTFSNRWFSAAGDISITAGQRASVRFLATSSNYFQEVSRSIQAP